MFADPITVTINSVAKVMGRRSTNGTSAVYATPDDLYTLTISHTITKGGLIRSLQRLDFKKVVADPLTSVNDNETLSTYVVTERPAFGFDSTEIKNQWSGFATWVNTTGTQDKVIARES